MKLKDKVAVVTGAGTGIGREIALAYAKEGANLVVADISYKDATAVVLEIESLGRKGLATHTDVAREKDVNDMAERALAEFGRIDILVNNAGGTFDSYLVPVKNLSLKSWQNVIDVNLTGTFLCARAVFPTMEGQKSGVIINVSSGKGKRGSAGYGVYSAAKAAVNNLTETLAEEGAPFNIRVNTMGPGGPVATRLGLEHDLIDSKEMLTVDVVVPLAVYLACDDSSGITGKNFNALLWNEEKGLGSPGRYIYRGTTDKK